MQQQEYAQDEKRYDDSLSDYLCKMIVAAYRWHMLEQQARAMEETRYHQYLDALEEQARATR